MFNKCSSTQCIAVVLNITLFVQTENVVMIARLSLFDSPALFIIVIFLVFDKYIFGILTV